MITGYKMYADAELQTNAVGLAVVTARKIHVNGIKSLWQPIHTEILKTLAIVRMPRTLDTFFMMLSKLGLFLVGGSHKEIAFQGGVQKRSAASQTRMPSTSRYAMVIFARTAAAKFPNWTTLSQSDPYLMTGIT